MHQFRFPVNNFFFKVFSGSPSARLSVDRLAVAVEAASPQRGVDICLKAPALSNTFLRFFPAFFHVGLQYAGFVGFLFQLTAVAPHSLAYFTGLGDEFTINIR